MENKRKANGALITACVLFVLFAAYTIAVRFVDRAAIGPEGSEVGFAKLNGAFADLVGVNMTWYKITQLLGYLALAVCVCFACVGVAQLIKRGSLKKVDSEIYILGGFYIVVIAFYALFEVLAVNYRPVILKEGLEASYPSSHTVLAVCVFLTAAYEIRRLLPGRKAVGLAADVISVVLVLVTVLGRAASGVHWLTDIAGACILSAALVSLYRAAVLFISAKRSPAAEE